MENSNTFFANKACEYFPCHETDKPEEFNCILCYCPLYALGEKCKGNFHYTAKGIKTCIDCMVPHRPNSVEAIKARFPEIAELAKKK